MSNAQPPPLAGDHDVFPVARASIVRVMDEQFAKGQAKYGTTLQTFNGRDAYEDALQEFADLGQYLTQLKMERDVLLARVDDHRLGHQYWHDRAGKFFLQVEELRAESVELHKRLGAAAAEISRLRGDLAMALSAGKR